jgi:hypothetical protein
MVEMQVQNQQQHSAARAMMNTNNFFSLPFAVAVNGTVLVGRRNTVKGVFGNKVFLKF